MKLRIALPTLHLILACVLLWSDYVWQQRLLHRIHGSFGPLPTFSLLIGINAPAGLMRAIWFRFVPAPWDSLLLIPVIGLLWYWMALNIESWRSERKICNFSWRPLRLLTDISVIAIGAVLSFVGYEELRHNVGASDVTVFIFSGGFIGWAAFLVIFFAMDLVSVLRPVQILPSRTH